MAGKNVQSGEFKTMGTSAAASSSPAPLRGTPRPRGQSKGGFLEAATATHRAGIQERLGAKLAPQATLYAPNAAEAGSTQRNVRLVPSAISGRDSFYSARVFGSMGL